MPSLTLMATARYPHNQPTPTQAPAIVTPHLSDTVPHTLPSTPFLPLSANGAPQCDRHPTDPRPRIPSVKDMCLLREYNKKYLGYADYDPSAASLGELFYTGYLSLSAVGNDTHANDATSTS